MSVDSEADGERATDHAVDGLVAELDDAAREHERLADRIRDRDGDVGAAVAAYRRFDDLLDRYRDRATGSGFEEYVEFQETVADVMDDLPADAAAREAFEVADDTVHQRRLSESDFDEARAALAPARDLAELVAERDGAREHYRDARRRAVRRIDELDDAIERLERLCELGEADLDAPVERLREPIAAYDDAVRAEFREWRRESPAREVLVAVERASAFPLVDWRAPPERLRSYLDGPAGEEPVSTLLEYADYSDSKLAHYVDAPGELKRHVATNRTYLRELTAEPVTVGWPPPGPDGLRYRAREYESAARAFATESTLAALRTVRALPRELGAEEYRRLRRAAAARADLDDAERERVRDGTARRELAAAREARERLSAALEAHPGPDGDGHGTGSDAG